MSNTIKIPLFFFLVLVTVGFCSHIRDKNKVKILITYCADSTYNDSVIFMADSSTFKELTTWKPTGESSLLYHDCWGTDELKIVSPKEKDMFLNKNSWYVALNYKILKK
jgi:hypothetical protein